MTGTEALIAYGFVEKDGRFVQPGRRTQEWQVTDGGFLRFEADGSACPFTPEDDVWSDDEVARIYGHAVAQKAAGWPGEEPGEVAEE